MTPATDRAFRESVSTLPPHEHRRDQLRPSRCASASCRSAKATPSSGWPARMATDRKEERFRILNGLGPTDRVRAGDQVKIVTE